MVTLLITQCAMSYASQTTCQDFHPYCLRQDAATDAAEIWHGGKGRARRRRIAGLWPPTGIIHVLLSPSFVLNLIHVVPKYMVDLPCRGYKPLLCCLQHMYENSPRLLSNAEQIWDSSIRRAVISGEIGWLLPEIPELLW